MNDLLPPNLCRTNRNEDNDNGQGDQRMIGHVPLLLQVGLATSIRWNEMARPADHEDSSPQDKRKQPRAEHQ